MVQVQNHSSLYASGKRYEAIKTDRDYWKARAAEKQTAAFRDGRMVGIIFTNVAWIVAVLAAFLIF